MNRKEILFLYDVKDANPNGDPMDSNKPRMDEETGFNIVTDVRLKRTIRDYLFDYKGYNGKDEKDIFVRETMLDEKKGFIKDGKNRAKDFNEKANEILEKCIDIRLFGGVLPLDKNSITFTGPVQFQMGRSLNKVEINHIKGTGAFASNAKSKQATFREEYVLPYSLIGFHGIVNENAGKHTNLTEEDVKLMLEGIWLGTKNLITRSKFGQMPRLLLNVNYNKSGFFIGELNNFIKISSDKRDEELRDISDFKLDVTVLMKKLEKYKENIESIEYLLDDRFELSNNGKVIEIEEVLNGKMQEIKF